jgi:hypothetical protein
MVAALALPTVNDDAKLLVGAASVAFPLCAVASAALLRRGHDRSAGVLLLLSVATPTYFAYVLNAGALVVGLGVLVVPRALLGPTAGSSAPA